MRFRRHVTSSAACPHCGLEETSIHCLRDCPRNQQVWTRLNIPQSHRFMTLSGEDWLRESVKQEYGSKLIAGMWCVWKARNACVFTGSAWNAFEILRSVGILVDEIGLFLRKNSSSPRLPRFVRWQPPVDGEIRLDIDGSALTNPGRAGFGGVFRDHNGTWLLGFSGFIGFTTNMHAELMALFQGLKLAIARNFAPLQCYTDSSMVVHLVSSSAAPTHIYGSIINAARNLLHRGGNCSLHHNLREANSVADWLAKYGAHSNDGLKLWDSPPEALRSALHADRIGISFLRL